MSFRIRPATPDDFDAIYEMAKLTGGGFTNLPADKGTLVEKLARSELAFDKTEEAQGNECYIFVLEDPVAGIIRGTCQVFGMVGTSQAFYSYHLSTLTQWSPELGKTFRNQMLTLTTDLEGSSEVGGLFLHPQLRAGGWGMLLARSRYLFIKAHRQRFGDRLLAELRGVMDEAGNSPFWDALAGRFFDMTFPEADGFNAVNGTHFIADLMPKTPIYVSLLADSAKAVMGQPHPTGRAALRMLQEEGLVFDRYIDIFDGGPTVTAPTDQVRSIRESGEETVVEVGGEPGKLKVLLAAGRLRDFRCVRAEVRRVGRKGIAITQQVADLLGISSGARVLMVGR
ncbi:arginine N-succinyltransferase [Sphingomonas glaciei]|uniref:Arginine N-succinyltransferase n=1 Tax=Sphingomonas glaciei TaxID=2938948 RepID=A0ABY5MXC4_9SPHN|nr:arginine N-succinyltransferase [Sphingomonas glaciei]UUR08948.1 arginine N-succinyltransferase [Sphingomonas glaciei]